MSTPRARWSAALLAFALGGLSGGTALAQDDPPPFAELGHEVVFDKPGYRTGDRVLITLTVTNTGDVETVAHGRHRLHEVGDIHFDPDAWGDLDFLDGPGVPLAPGESHTQRLGGVIADPGRAEAVLDAYLVTHLGHSFDVRASAPVEVVSGAIAGTVYLDRDGDGTVDDGEPVAGAKVSVSNSFDSTSAPHTTTTDAEGRYRVGGLAPVRHRVTVEPVDGWQFDLSSPTVVADETVEVPLRGVAPFDRSLKAQLRLVKDTYQPGDTAEFDLTLTNTGTIPLLGVKAFCDRAGNAHHLTDIAWGDLAYGADGVDLAAGATYQHRFSGTVPEAARRYGVVTLACDFGMDTTDNPQARDEARVPGTTGSITVTPYHDKDGDDVPDAGERIRGVDVVLTHNADPALTATRRTGRDGVAAFTAIATGGYGVEVGGPWDVVAGQGWVGVVAEGCWVVCDWPVKVVPGASTPTAPTTAPTPPSTPVTTAPAPAPRPAPPGSLPDTGADVRALFGVGVLAVLGGAALMLVRRKRA
ncbi:SdrD B-like domain-containing protein [Actinokineospora guangxiensis]|uniref:SdrD B-like domain-containing protein n=1 Tax=Actinokineospora guangxiensis TaxID=1490288 RepID=A0ABW0EH14_9PSEU